MTTQHAAHLLAAVALLTPLAGLRAADEKVAGDLKKIQGRWSTPAADGTKVTYAFDGAKLKVVAPSRSYEMVVTLDPEAKPDKTIDFKIVEGPGDSKGQTSKGIYKFDGDDLVFCFSPQGNRPTKFEQEGYEKIVSKLTRMKE